MPELSLTQVFGAGTTENATTLTIPKSNLGGVIPAATNPADSLAAGLIIRLNSVYTQAARAANPDQSLVVSLNALPSTAINLTVSPPQNLLVYRFNCEIYSPFDVTPLDPNSL
jgi:hypothetical protein